MNATVPLRAWTHMTATEAKLVWRDPAGMLVPIGLPTLILVMNALGADAVALPGADGLTAVDVFVAPLTLVMVLSMVALVNMPSFLATYRKTGVLRRLAVTPASPVMVLVAQVAVSVAQALGGMAVAWLVAWGAFDVAAPRNPGGALVAIAAGACALYAVGLLVAALSRSTNAAIAWGLVLFLGTMALGGGFGGRDNLPGALATVGEYSPYGATFEALQASWLGAAPAAGHLAALLVTGLVAGTLAAWRFRWE